MTPVRALCNHDDRKKQSAKGGEVTNDRKEEEERKYTWYRNEDCASDKRWYKGYKIVMAE